MHELGVIAGILKTIEKTMIDRDLAEVETIVLQVGEFSGVIPDFLEDCFPAAVYGTKFEKTKLKLEMVPGLVRCDACGLEFNARIHSFKCPGCGSKDLSVLSGREFLIKEIHAY